jgi:4'-phosphopantetheinyl transferase
VTASPPLDPPVGHAPPWGTQRMPESISAGINTELCVTATQRCTASIDRGNVDVWRIDLDVLTPARWAQVVSTEEFAEAARLRRPRDRDRFLQGRYCLRLLLARYLGKPAAALGLYRDANGKPQLPAADGLSFNVTHSGALAAIAIGRQRQIGIDIECAVLPEDVRGLAQQVFSAAENSAFADLDDTSLTLPFLTGWTRKEAYLKALGVGLYRDPRSVDVGLEAQPLQLDDANGAAIAISTLPSDADCVLSLAVSSVPYAAPAAVCIQPFDVPPEAA